MGKGGIQALTHWWILNAKKWFRLQILKIVWIQIKREQHIKSNVQAQLRHNRWYLDAIWNNANLNHSGTVP